MSIVQEKQIKVGDFSLGEAFAIGISKTLSEQLLTPIIGNGSYMSGGSKLLLSWGLAKTPYIKKFTNNKVGKVVMTALAIDGVEDIIRNLFIKGVADASTSGQLI